MTETDLALLRTFYDAYGDYFGAEPEPFDGTALDAADRATLAGIRAAIAMPCEAPSPKGSGPSGLPSAGQRHRPHAVGNQINQGERCDTAGIG